MLLALGWAAVLCDSRTHRWEGVGRCQWHSGYMAAGRRRLGPTSDSCRVLSRLLPLPLPAQDLAKAHGGGGGEEMMHASKAQHRREAPAAMDFRGASTAGNKLMDSRHQ